jgi:VanZ family protein
MQRSPRLLRSPVIRLVPVVLWFGVIFYQSSRSQLPFPPGFSDQLVSMAGHFTEYAILSTLLWWGLGAILADQRKRVLVVLGVALLYAISDEWHQSFVPGRTPDVWDVVVDMIGATAGIVIARWVLGRMASRKETSGRPMSS